MKGKLHHHNNNNHGCHLLSANSVKALVWRLYDKPIQSSQPFHGVGIILHRQENQDLARPSVLSMATGLLWAPGSPWAAVHPGSGLAILCVTGG